MAMEDAAYGKVCVRKFERSKKERGGRSAREVRAAMLGEEVERVCVGVGVC